MSNGGREVWFITEAQSCLLRWPAMIMESCDLPSYILLLAALYFSSQNQHQYWCPLCFLLVLVLFTLDSFSGSFDPTSILTVWFHHPNFHQFTLLLFCLSLSLTVTTSVNSSQLSILFFLTFSFQPWTITHGATLTPWTLLQLNLAILMQVLSNNKKLHQCCQLQWMAPPWCC